MLAIPQLEKERDRLHAQQTQLGELHRLQTENDRLLAQVHQLQAEMSDPRKMLERMLAQQSAATSEPSEPDATINHRPVAAAPTPIAAPTTRRPSKAETSDAPKSRNLEETKEKIGHIIDAMISWNSSQETSSQMLAISIPAIKGIAAAIGASYQKAIQEVVAERREQLDELNQLWMLGSRHNATVRGKDEILRTIARENLGLENWQAIEFA